MLLIVNVYFFLNNQFDNQWNVIFEKLDSSTFDCKTTWKNVWNGHCMVILPYGTYYLALCDGQTVYPCSSSIGRWWTKHRVPAFLRRCVPVVWKDGRIVHEFLTGKIMHKSPDGPFVKIEMSA